MFFCPNNNFPERDIQVMTHFVGADCMDIKGLGKKQIRQFEYNVIKDYTNIIDIPQSYAKINQI